MCKPNGWRLRCGPGAGTSVRIEKINTQAMSGTRLPVADRSQGLFVREIENAYWRVRSISRPQHEGSTSSIEPGLLIAAVEAEDPRDVVVSRHRLLCRRFPGRG